MGILSIIDNLDYYSKEKREERKDKRLNEVTEYLRQVFASQIDGIKNISEMKIQYSSFKRKEVSELLEVIRKNDKNKGEVVVFDEKSEKSKKDIFKELTVLLNKVSGVELEINKANHKDNDKSKQLEEYKKSYEEILNNLGRLNNIVGMKNSYNVDELLADNYKEVTEESPLTEKIEKTIIEFSANIALISGSLEEVQKLTNEVVSYLNIKQQKNEIILEFEGNFNSLGNLIDSLKNNKPYELKDKDKNEKHLLESSFKSLKSLKNIDDTRNYNEELKTFLKAHKKGQEIEGDKKLLSEIIVGMLMNSDSLKKFYQSYNKVIEEPVKDNKVIEEPVKDNKVIEEPVKDNKVIEEPVKKSSSLDEKVSAPKKEQEKNNTETQQNSIIKDIFSKNMIEFSNNKEALGDISAYSINELLTLIGSAHLNNKRVEYQNSKQGLEVKEALSEAVKKLESKKNEELKKITNGNLSGIFINVAYKEGDTEKEKLLTIRKLYDNIQSQVIIDLVKYVDNLDKQIKDGTKEELDEKGYDKLSQEIKNLIKENLDKFKFNGHGVEILDKGDSEVLEKIKNSIEYNFNEMIPVKKPEGTEQIAGKIEEIIGKLQFMTLANSNSLSIRSQVFPMDDLNFSEFLSKEVNNPNALKIEEKEIRDIPSRNLNFWESSSAFNNNLNDPNENAYWNSYFELQKAFPKDTKTNIERVVAGAIAFTAATIKAPIMAVSYLAKGIDLLANSLLEIDNPFATLVGGVLKVISFTLKSVVSTFNALCNLVMKTSIFFSKNAIKKAGKNRIIDEKQKIKNKLIEKNQIIKDKTNQVEAEHIKLSTISDIKERESIQKDIDKRDKEINKLKAQSIISYKKFENLTNAGNKLKSQRKQNNKDKNLGGLSGIKSQDREPLLPREIMSVGKKPEENTINNA